MAKQAIDQKPKAGAADSAPLWRTASIAIILILGIGMLIGRVANSGYTNPWFNALVKPAIMPPGWVFGVVWTLLYILLGIAVALVLRRREAPGRTAALGLFIVQLLLNFSWSPVFFRFHQVRLGFFLILLIFVLSLAACQRFARIDKRAMWMMFPYLAWLVFAAFLNYRILQLNLMA